MEFEEGEQVGTGVLCACLSQSHGIQILAASTSDHETFLELCICEAPNPREPWGPPCLVSTHWHVSRPSGMMSHEGAWKHGVFSAGYDKNQ